MKGTQMKPQLSVVENEAPSRLLAEHSAARMHLAKLINSRLSIESKLRHLGESAHSLKEVQAEEQNAVGELNALNAAEAAAMTAWSRDPSGPVPEPDVVKREELEAKRRSATAKATAARQAEATISADIQRENAALAQVKAKIELAIVPVIVDEVEPLLADFEEANRILAAKAGKIAEASEIITQIGHGIGNSDLARPAFVCLEKLNERIRLAFARPAPDVTNHRAAWLAFAAELKRDPIAELKD
jgi:hypothetical protein